MKPFDLEKALAGEPVMLTSGEKAYIKVVIDNAWHAQSRDSFDKCLVGYIERSTNYIMCWHITGKAYHESISIKCMWEEPRPRVQLDLPCPMLNSPKTGDIVYALVGYSYTDNGIPYIKEIKYNLKTEEFNALQSGLLFKSKEDAQEWLDAIRNARR